MQKPNMGIYVHVPFCVHKCNYCDFNSYAGMDDVHAEYFKALCRETEFFAEKYGCGWSADTVYIGGGTPSCVEPKYIAEVLEKIFSSFNICGNTEITLECNPGTISREGLSDLHRAGVNRLSIGLQSTDDAMLRTLGRIHTLRDFEECFASARGAGFENVSADLMYGLPNQSTEHWRNTLEKAASFGAEHISCYSLKIEEGTPFYAQGVSVPDDDTVADMYADCVAILGTRGYGRYEISNFAKPGFESRHNLKYWRCEDFIGFGAGAYSCMKDSRFSNILDVREYLGAVERTGSAVHEKTDLTDWDKMSEFVFLGLRCEKGINSREFSARFDRDIFDVFGDAFAKYIKLGFILYDGVNIRFSENAFFVSNAILADFV